MKKLLGILTAFLLVVTLAACDNASTTEAGNSSDGTNTVTGDVVDDIVFGLIGPLTGEYSVYGLGVENGAKLAAAEINAAGGVLGANLEIIAYDSKGDSTEGVTAYNRLVTQDGIDALIGATFSGVTLAIKELAIYDEIPVLTPTATHPDVTVDADNVFRACYTDSYQGSVAAVFTAENLNSTNAAVLFNRDDAYSEGLATAFMAEYDAKGLSYTAFEFGKDDDDFNALLTNIKNGDFDVVFLPAYTAEVGKVLTQANTLGLSVPFVGGDGWDGIEADYADVAEGFYFVNHYAKSDEAEVVQNFVTNYQATYGEAPSALAALAYDAVYAMVAAFEAAGSTDNAAVVTALQGLNFTNAVTGSITFDEQGDPIKSITVIKIVDGEHVVETKVEAN